MQAVMNINNGIAQYSLFFFFVLAQIKSSANLLYR